MFNSSGALNRGVSQNELYEAAAKGKVELVSEELFPTAAVLMLILQVSSSVQNAMRPTMGLASVAAATTALVPLLPLASGGWMEPSART